MRKLIAMFAVLAVAFMAAPASAQSEIVLPQGELLASAELADVSGGLILIDWFDILTLGFFPDFIDLTPGLISTFSLVDVDLLDLGGLLSLLGGALGLFL